MLGVVFHVGVAHVVCCVFRCTWETSYLSVPTYFFVKLCPALGPPISLVPVKILAQ